MAALKWVMISVCSLAALGLTGFGVKGSLGLRGNEPSVPTVAKISLRALPAPFVVGTASPKPTATTRPAEQAVDAGVAPVVAAPVVAPPVAAVKPDAGAAIAVVDAGAHAPVVKAAPPPVAPVAPVPAPVVAAPVADGVLNLQASDTADVFVDGKRMGASPVLGVKVKVGAHKVRFDCYDAAGNTVAGAVQNVTAVANKEVDVSFTCPASE